MLITKLELDFVIKVLNKKQLELVSQYGVIFMSLEQAVNGEYSFYREPEIALAKYQEFGFHLEKALFTPDYCETLIAAGNNLAGAQAGNFKPALMPHREDTIFFDALKNKKVVAVINHLVGGTPVGIQTQFFYCQPGTRGFSLHQDNFYVEADQGKFASVWVGLVDSGPSNGGILVYPGSHAEGNLPVKKLNLTPDPKQDRNANNEATDVPNKYQAYNLTLARGTGLFLHAHTVHGSNDNQSNKPRYSVLNLYLQEGEKFRSGQSAQRQPIALI
jgi:phytanoyl-CoA hydroxylase